MKLMQYITIVLLILYPNIIMAQSIKDISRNDANYKLINNAIIASFFILFAPLVDYFLIQLPSHLSQ